MTHRGPRRAERSTVADDADDKAKCRIVGDGADTHDRADDEAKSRIIDNNAAASLPTDEAIISFPRWARIIFSRYLRMRCSTDRTKGPRSLLPGSGARLHCLIVKDREDVGYQIKRERVCHGIEPKRQLPIRDESKDRTTTPVNITVRKKMGRSETYFTQGQTMSQSLESPV